MGYNATYGLPYNDDFTKTECSNHKNGTLSFFEVDIGGNLHVQMQYAHCANCGESFKGQTSYVHGVTHLCKKCETKFRMNARKNKQTKTTKEKKAVK
jgi:recombinational DNA repair protein (RecF pathway)